MAKMSWIVPLLWLGFVAQCGAAAPQIADFPDRPLRVIVPFAPGGTNDIVARLLGPALTGMLGQQIVVDNRTGASGNLGMQLAAAAQPNGYTLFVGNVGTNAINPTLFPPANRPDTAKPLRAVTLLATASNLLVSGAKFPPQNFKDLITYAKANPGKLNYNNTYGSHGHLSMLDLATRTGLDIVHVPIQGGGAGLTSLVSGEVHTGLPSAAAVLPLIQARRLKAFVTTADVRLAQLPEVPTFTEVGFPELAALNWLGLFVPAATPQILVDNLFKVSTAAMQTHEIKAALATRIIQVEVSKSPQEFERYVNVEIRRWAEIIRRNHIRSP